MSKATARSGRATYVVLLAGSLVLLVAVFLPLWKPLFLAAVLAGAMGGLQRRLTGRLGGRRRLSAGLLLVGLLALVLAPLSVLATYLVSQAISLGEDAYHLFQTEGVEGLIALAPDRLEPFVRQQSARLPQSFGAWASTAAERGVQAATAIGGALSTTGSLIFQLVMMLVALYFLLVDGPKLADWFKSVSPLGGRLTGTIFAELRRTATSVLSSTVATAFVQSILATLGYSLARVPAPLVFGFITFLAAFIPSVGTAAVSIPIAIVLLIAGHLVAGLFLLAWSIFVTGTVDNVLKPVLARGGARLNGALIFFAMISGILSFGALGLIIGPTALSLLVALTRIGQEELTSKPMPPLMAAGRTAVPAEQPHEPSAPH